MCKGNSKDMGGGRWVIKKKVGNGGWRKNQSFQVWTETNEGESILSHFPPCWASPVPAEAGCTFHSLYLPPPLGPLTKCWGFSSWHAFISVQVLYLQTCEKDAHFWSASERCLLTAPLPTPPRTSTGTQAQSDPVSLTLRHWPREPDNGLWWRITLLSDPQENRMCLHGHEA